MQAARIRKIDDVKLGVFSGLKLLSRNCEMVYEGYGRRRGIPMAKANDIKSYDSLEITDKVHGKESSQVDGLSSIVVRVARTRSSAGRAR